MVKFRQISLLLGILMPLLITHSYCQTNTFLKPVRVAKGSYVSINDSLVYFKNDTVIYISDSYMPQDTSLYSRTIVFYDSLKAKAERKNITKILYDIVVVPPARISASRMNERNINNYTEHSGKIIRHIFFRRLNAFGTTINDPEASLENEQSYFLNKTHIKTREYVLKNYLIIEENDSS